MPEKPYSERVADFVTQISNPDFVKGAKIEVTDEYQAARLAAAHFGGNILGSRRLYLAQGEKPITPTRKAKNLFLKGLGKIDTSQLPPEKAQEFRTIILTAKTGNWNSLEFVNTLNTYCHRFSLQQPILQEQDES
jgi:hypothetical protein